MGAALWQGCLLPVWASGGLRYGVAGFITLFKCLSQGFNALGAYNTRIKYAGASNQHIGLKPQRELAGK